MSVLSLPRSALLVSVRSPVEAAAALAGGADVVDIKEPAAGSLGAASPQVCREVALVVGDQAPWTMACGELADGVQRLDAHLGATWERLGEDGSRGCRLPWAIKVGLAGCGLAGCSHSVPWRDQLAAVGSRLPAGVGQVLVIYADAEGCLAPPAAEVLAAAAELGAAAVLVDTFSKQSAGLLGHTTVSQLREWREAAATAGCGFAVAGKLQVEEFPALSPVDADIIAVRSAVCSHGRTGPVEPLLVQRARQGLVGSPQGRGPSEGETPGNTGAQKTGTLEKRS